MTASAAAGCEHCELPLGRRPLRAAVDGRPRAFCCAGCLLAFQITRARGESGAASAILVRLGLAVFFAMNVMMLSLPTYVTSIYGAAAGDGPLFLALRVLAAVLAAPVLALLGWPILASGWQALRAGAPNADALIILGTLAAYALSWANLLRGSPAVYFDTASMLLVLVTAGRWLEAHARAEAGAAIRRTLTPLPARVVRERPAPRATVAPGDLVPGDVMVVGPGDAIPVDGVVVEGRGGVDESSLTGESFPVAKRPGANVAGGTISVDGVLHVRAVRGVDDSAAARVAALLAAACRERTAAERIADRVTRALTPAVVAVAFGAAAIWTWRAGPEAGVLAGLAVLVVACPCALGIATPVALWAGLGAASRRGVVIRGAAVLERAARVGHVLFDKTGTLTEPVPHVARIDAVAGVEADTVLACAASIEADVPHPLARAVVAAADAAGLAAPAAREVRILPGLGVRGRVGSDRVRVGRGMRPGVGARAAVSVNGHVIGRLHFSEVLRAGATEAVGALRGTGVRVGLVSGDARADVAIPSLMTPAEAALALTPAGKIARIRAARREAVVAMVGDGINDAPALAAADVGIAVASATDLARMAADVVVLGGDLRAVPWLLGHARRVQRVLHQNLAWAFGYNAVAVALAAAGLLTPLVASVAMLGSSLVVVANARRVA